MAGGLLCLLCWASSGVSCGAVDQVGGGTVAELEGDSRLPAERIF